MKKLLLMKNSMVLCLGIILILSITSSCTKSSSDTGGGTGQQGANEVWIQSMAFSPASITVPVGTTIKWTNKDGVTHNVTSTTSIFSSGAMSNGASFSFTFATAGSYPYTCSIHPMMTGTVVVQ